MEEKLSTHLFTPAKEYLSTLDPDERAKIMSSIYVIQMGDLSSIHTKQLEGPLRELIVGNHRVTYFVITRALYVVDGFRKKTAKTPKRHIDFAKKMYKYIKNNI
jgi:phage-related protein